jgi:hypothetical protein|tara:strand:+ start:563 stop:823 length:261 start_codon:yes stop_codon:yes gene_type:complete
MNYYELRDPNQFGSVLDRLMHNEPMRWQGMLMDMETNKLSLVAFRKWLSAEWYEKELLRDDFPELAFLDDDMLVMEMQHELLASLN